MRNDLSQGRTFAGRAACSPSTSPPAVTSAKPTPRAWIARLQLTALP